MLNVERSLQITETRGFKEKYFAIKGLVRIWLTSQKCMASHF